MPGTEQPSDFVVDGFADHAVEPGSTAYALLRRGAAGTWSCEALAPVAVPRLRHPETRSDLLPGFLRPACEDPSQMSSAGRVFGWVRPGRDDDSRDQSRRGRVRFSHGELREGSMGDARRHLLPALGAPHATATALYLRERVDEDGNPVGRNTRFPRTLDHHDLPFALYRREEADLRGWKLYRRRAIAGLADDGSEAKLRKHVGVRPPGETFVFHVEFDGLKTAELGALLFSLDLGDASGEEQRFHMLGAGKPLGMGRAVIRVVGAEIHDPTDCDAATRWRQVPGCFAGTRAGQCRTWATIGVLAAARSSFERAWSADDAPRATWDALLEMLKVLPGDVDVDYPVMRGAVGKQFEWFVTNRKRAKQRLPEPVVETTDPTRRLHRL